MDLRQCSFSNRHMPNVTIWDSSYTLQFFFLSFMIELITRCVPVAVRADELELLLSGTGGTIPASCDWISVSSSWWVWRSRFLTGLGSGKFIDLGDDKIGGTADDALSPNDESLCSCLLLDEVWCNLLRWGTLKPNDELRCLFCNCTLFVVLLSFIMPTAILSEMIALLLDILRAAMVSCVKSSPADSCFDLSVCSGSSADRCFGRLLFGLNRASVTHDTRTHSAPRGWARASRRSLKVGEIVWSELEET